ncbi:MAG: trypsin-like serine protease [Alphaproteobacteria bacterium]|nr:trypsin-like serine protease [Alphaproteobacteria bacterium]
MDRFTRIVLSLFALAAVAYLAQPSIERLLFASTTPRAVTPRGDLSQLEKSTIELFERVAPSVVQVVALAGGAGEGQGAGSGTGFVWDAAGHVVTNNHVIENAGRVAVRLATGTVSEAAIAGRAPNYDLAVLRLVRPASVPPPVAIGTSRDLRVGQSAFAIGNPFGLDQSLTTGVISALKRRLPTSGGREIADVIQTDAAINPGNSGGPLLDSAGRLIGVNTAIFSPSGAYAGIGFAIPVDVVNRVVPELIRSGRVPVPGIGIVAAGEEDAARLGVAGLIVAQVVPGLPAQRAGVQGVDRASGTLGDIVEAANGEPVRRLADLTDVLERIGVGNSVTLTLRRGGRSTSVSVQVVDIGQR